MDVRTLRALEWDRVLALLSLCASTAEGKARAGALLPGADADTVRERHARVAECLAGEALCGRLSLEGYGRIPTHLPSGLSFPLDKVVVTLAPGEPVVLAVGLTRGYAKSDEPEGPKVHWVQVNNFHFAGNPAWELDRRHGKR